MRDTPAKKIFAKETPHLTCHYGGVGVEDLEIKSIN